MRVFVQRVSREDKYWRIRFSAAGTNAFTGNLITTVLVPTRNTSLKDALGDGAIDARRRFALMRKFNQANDGQ